jgi:hypothetical protein
MVDAAGGGGGMIKTGEIPPCCGGGAEGVPPACRMILFGGPDPYAPPARMGRWRSLAAAVGFVMIFT